ncbi:NAD-dependent epimerase/dehydratase family protein [Synechococcus sp. MEDNS5]|uniref:NAD-dependent epimerase/dehydratase family protein n=1 Tax=Synechococcus sp. MEDNS5 TaxID=1442554 RepID=UPI001644694A|nr:NAD-dependent epimerase/dehydratase family protein [Synechococcus sp. MEDNS5]
MKKSKLNKSGVKFAITGGAGFVGYNLMLLLEKEFIKPIFYIIDDLSSSTLNDPFLPNNNIEKGRITWIKASISTLDLTEVFDKVDIVIHLAAKGNVVQSIELPIDNFNSNVVSTLHILDCLRNSSCNKLIFSSTGGALMGNTEPPVDEMSLPSPISPYGSSKLACEGYIKSFSHVYDLDACIFRFGNVYGPYCLHKQGVFNKFANAFLDEQEIVIYGDGSSTRDYVNVYDICMGIISGCHGLLSNSLRAYNCFHLSSGVQTSLNQLCDYFIKASDRKPKVTYLPKRKGEVEVNFADYSRALQALEYSPTISIQKGVAEFYAWYLSSRIIKR